MLRELEHGQLLFLALFGAWLLQCHAAHAHLSDECTSNCGEMPSQRQYYCSISSTWIYSSVYPSCRKLYVDDPQSTPCVAYVGMEVHMYCTDNDTTLYYNGYSFGASHNVYEYVRRPHGGVYECRHSNGSLYAHRNLSIKAEPVVSVGERDLNPCNDMYCFYAYNGASCCKVGMESGWLPVYIGVNFSFNVYGEEPISISVEATWNESNHYPVDLGITLYNSSTATKNMTFTKWPKTVDERKTPAPVIVVNASNSYGYSTTCFTWAFKEIYPDLFADSSLPKNQTVLEGQSAVFTCHIGVHSRLSSSMQIQYTTPSGPSPQIWCRSFECQCVDEDCTIDITVMEQSYSGALDTFYYEIKVRSAVLEDSGAFVSCALLFVDVIQWKQQAWLTVEPRRPLKSSGSSDHMSMYVSVPVVILALCIVVSAVVIGVVVHIRRRRSRRQQRSTVSSNRGYTRMHTQPSPTVSMEVYISYTKSKTLWVLKHLKPLVESFHPDIVVTTLQNTGADPDKQLQEVLRADKVIVVCSPDYSSSPWCRYELYQAVSKEPSFTNGQIIPILCDGCTSTPEVIRPIVTLSDTDESFAEKLKIALQSTPQ